MGFEDDLRRVEEHVAEARRIVQGQKGLIVRLRAAGVGTLDAQRILWLLESNLRRLEEHRDRLSANAKQTKVKAKFPGLGLEIILKIAADSAFKPAPK